MGTLTRYVERFGESDDVARAHDERLKKLDRLTEIVMGWLDSELAGDTRYKGMRDKLADGLRSDARNLLLMHWTRLVIEQYVKDGGDKTTEKPEPGEREERRVQLFLADRGYFDMKDLPAMERAFKHGDDTSRCLVLQRVIASKLGCASNEPIPASLSFLNTSKTAEDSLRRHLATTPEYQAMLAKWETEKNEKPDAAKPEETQIISDLFCSAMGVSSILSSGEDGFKLRLATGIQPVNGNGKWNAETGEMVWDLRSIKAILPWICYADWAEPDKGFQESRFGKVVLDGGPLESYVMWRAGLTPEEGAKWDSFVAGLIPNPELRQKIESFRFAPDDGTGTDKKKSDLSDTPRNLLLKALGEGK